VDGKRVQDGWLARLPRGEWVNLDGNRYPKPTGQQAFKGDTKAEAISRRDEAVRASVKCTDVRTVADMLDYWMADVEKRRTPGTNQLLANGTILKYRCYVDAYIKPALGDVMAANLTRQAIQDFLDAMETRVGASMLKGIKGTLVRAYADMIRWKEPGIEWNPAAATRPIPRAPATRQPLSAEQQSKLLDAASGHTREAAFRVMLALGLGPGEALGLMWSDWDRQKGVIHIQRNAKLHGDERADLLTPGMKLGRVKRPSRDEFLPVDEDLASVLIGHEVTQTGQPNPLGLMFPTATGMVASPDTLRKSMKRLCARAGLPPHLTPAQCRTTAASETYRATADLVVTARLMRHSSTKSLTGIITSTNTETAEKHYVKTNVDDLRAAVAKRQAAST
jgi:integrase